MKRVFLIALLGSFLLYWTGLTAPFYLDDTHVIDQAHNPGWPPQRLLGYASFWITDYAATLFHSTLPLPEPTYHRLWNVGIHAGASTALFWLVLQLAGPWTATAASALFLAHPIQTQAITYISQRFESQAALFMLLCAGAYIRFRKSQQRKWLAMSCACGIAALLTKETAFILPLWILFFEWSLFGTQRLKRTLLIAGAIVAPLALLLLMRTMPSILSSVFTWVPLDQYWLSQGAVLAKYIQLLTWPAHQYLFYEFNPVSPSWTLLAQWNTVFILLAAGICCLRRFPLAGFGILSFFLLLLPVLILPLPDMINEHRLYLPFAGIAIAVAVLAQKVKPWYVSVLTMAFLVGFLGARTSGRNAEWADEGRFLEANLAAFPHYSEILNRLGTHYVLRGNWERSLDFYRESRKYEGRTSSYYRQQAHLLTAINMASINATNGRWKEARTEAQRAVAANPKEVIAWRLLGNIALQSGDFPAARQSFTRWAMLQPGTGPLQALQLAAINTGELDLAGRIGAVLQNQDPPVESKPWSIPSTYLAHVLFLLSSSVIGLAAFLAQK